MVSKRKVPKGRVSKRFASKSRKVSTTRTKGTGPEISAPISSVMAGRPRPLLTIRADNTRAKSAAGSAEVRSALVLARTFDRLDRERIGINKVREEWKKWNAAARDKIKTVRDQLM